MISFTISALATIEALGEHNDWYFNSPGNVFWQDSIEPSGGLSFDGPQVGEYCELQGCAVAVLDAAVPDFAPCQVTLTNPSDAGEIAVSIKGGEAVQFVFPNGGSEVTMTVIAGDQSNLRLTNAAPTTQSHVGRIRIVA